METQTQNELPLYDTEVAQRIPFSVERDGYLYEIAYVLGPQTDAAISEYDRRCDRRLMQADEREAGERNAFFSRDKSFEAAVWLFDNRLEDVDGFGEPGEERPENWKDLIATPQDKAAAIDRAYLAVMVVPAPAAEGGKRLSWQQSTESSPKIYLKALFEGYELSLTHELKDPSAKELSEYESIMKDRFLVRGTRLGKSETRISPKSKRLATLYDQLIVKTTGYKTNVVPMHHKALVVIEHLGSEHEELRKN